MHIYFFSETPVTQLSSPFNEFISQSIPNLASLRQDQSWLYEFVLTGSDNEHIMEDKLDFEINDHILDNLINVFDGAQDFKSNFGFELCTGFLLLF